MNKENDNKENNNQEINQERGNQEIHNENTSKEETKEINTGKINFFKKVWFSVTKINKYEEMTEQGIKSSIKYFFTLMALIALILAIIATFIQSDIVKDALSYLDEKLPEMKIADNKLSLENEEVTILDEVKFTDYFGCIVVINPLLEKQQAIDEYNNLATQKYKCIVFLSDEYLVISSNYDVTNESENDSGIETHKYSDEMSKYVQDTSREYGKQDIISYLGEKTSFTYYIAQYFVVYFVMIALIYIFYILLISVSFWLITKFAKINITFKKSLSNTIYASTLSSIVYVAYIIISYFTKFSISFFDVISILLIYVYLCFLLAKERKEKNVS